LSSTKSTPPPRRRLTAQARRELIEQAACELFAARGYIATSIDEIAKRAGVTAPVLYDHFVSKRDLHRRLLERHFAELRRLWSEQLRGEEPAEQRVARAIDAWFAYVEEHPYAWRMLFRDTTGEPEVRAIHEEVIAQSRAAMMPLFLRERGGAESRSDGAQPAGGGAESRGDGAEPADAGAKPRSDGAEPADVDATALEMGWEVMRAVLQGLALWWYEHREVPRERIVASAMNSLWIGFERVRAGESWQP
jgi:AcrR family transcriptional regulator